MQKVFIALLLSLILSPLAAQKKPDCEKDLVFSVIAPSGLRMRSAPNTSSKVITTVPYDSLVIACTETFGKFSTKTTEGYWRYVQYKAKEGYMYDGYLLSHNTMVSSMDSIVDGRKDQAKKVALPPINFSLATETYNFCGEVEKLNPGINWYGIYPPSDASSEYSMEKVKVEVVLSEQRLSKSMEFDIKTDREEKSIFLVGSEQPLKRGTVLYLNREMQEKLPMRLFPGQQEMLYARSVVRDDRNISISGLGSVTSAGECPQLKEYQLMASTKLGQEEVTQDIAQLVRQSDDCGVPELLWFGDLNDDGYADCLWASRGASHAQFSLLVSRIDDKVIWHLADTWTVENCP